MFMRWTCFALVAVAAALAVLPALAEQDGPMRKAGSFAAKAEGAVGAAITGDASVSQGKSTRHLYLTMNSDQMMVLKTMISADVMWPSANGAGRHEVLERTARPAVTAIVSWEDLETRARHAVAATGYIDFDAKDPMAGRFELTAKDGSDTLKLTGTFENAPVTPALD
jgi:hypothetical protein